MVYCDWLPITFTWIYYQFFSPSLSLSNDKNCDIKIVLVDFLFQHCIRLCKCPTYAFSPLVMAFHMGLLKCNLNYWWTLLLNMVGSGWVALKNPFTTVYNPKSTNTNPPLYIYIYIYIQWVILILMPSKML